MLSYYRIWLSSDNQDENVATIKVRTRGRDATSGKTMAVWGTRSKRMGDGGGERDGGHASASSADLRGRPPLRHGEHSEPGRGGGPRGVEVG